MKKILPLTLISLLVFSIMSSVYAASYKAELKSSKNEIKPSESFTVEFKISNIEDEKGLISIGGELKYDKNVLEFESMNEEGSWAKPTYNEENGKFIFDRSGPTKENEGVFKVTFKAKESTSGDTTISVENIEASSEAEEISTDKVSATVSIGEKPLESKPENSVTNNTVNQNTSVKPSTGGDAGKSGSGTGAGTNNSNTNSDNKIKTNTVTDKDNVKKGVLPKAGNQNVVLSLIGILTVLVIIFYIRFEMINKKINKSR